MILKRRTSIYIVSSTMLVVVLFMLKILGLEDYPTIMGFILISIFSIFTLKKTQIRSKEYGENIIIIASYFIHLLLLLVDVYGKEYITLLHSGSDSEGFYRIASMYYQGDFSEHNTYYPYIINYMFQFTGISRLSVQYINVLFWFASVLVLQNICNLLNIKGKYRIITIFLFCFLPNYLILTSLLMRESMISFFILISFLYLIKWMQLGKVTDAVKASIFILPAILLHSGSFVILVVYCVVIAFYSPKYEKIGFQKKTGGIVFIGCFVVIGAFMIPAIRKLFLFYIPSFENGLIEMANQRIWMLETYSGGSTYLVGMHVSNYMDLFIKTVQRMYYFLFSPLPTHWRGVGDVIAFFMDGFFYLWAFIVGVISWVKKKNPYQLVMILIIVGMCIIFAWGVGNAGTAMRHRDKMVGIVIVLLCYSYQKKHDMKNKSVEV